MFLAESGPCKNNRAEFRIRVDPIWIRPTRKNRIQIRLKKLIWIRPDPIWFSRYIMKKMLDGLNFSRDFKSENSGQNRIQRSEPEKNWIRQKYPTPKQFLFCKNIHRKKMSLPVPLSQIRQQPV